MTTIRELLKETRPLADTTKVKLQLHLPLGKARVNATILGSLGVVKAILDRGKDSAAKKAGVKAKTAVANKGPEAKTAPKATGKKSTKVAGKTKAKTDTTAVNSKTTRVTQATVLAAINTQNSTTQAIADVINASPLQVSKALSRYTQQGLIERTKPGHYALKQ